MYLNASLMALKISNSSLSGPILIILQQVIVLLLFGFLFYSQYFCHCFHFSSFYCELILMKIYSNSITERNILCLNIFFCQIKFLFPLGFIVLWLYYLVLNLCTAVVLQSMITLFASSLRIKILLNCVFFFVRLLVQIYVFYGLKHILQYSTWIFMI